MSSSWSAEASCTPGSRLSTTAETVLLSDASIVFRVKTDSYAWNTAEMTLECALYDASSSLKQVISVAQTSADSAVLVDKRPENAGAAPAAAAAGGAPADADAAPAEGGDAPPPADADAATAAAAAAAAAKDESERVAREFGDASFRAEIRLAALPKHCHTAVLQLRASSGFANVAGATLVVEMRAAPTQAQEEAGERPATIELGTVAVPVNGAHDTVPMCYLAYGSVARVFRLGVFRDGRTGSEVKELLSRRAGTDVRVTELYEKQSALARIQTELPDLQARHSVLVEECIGKRKVLCAKSEALLEMYKKAAKEREDCRTAADRLKAEGNEEGAAEQLARIGTITDEVAALEGTVKTMKAEVDALAQSERELAERILAMRDELRSGSEEVGAERAKAYLAEPDVSSTLERTFAIIKPDAVAAGVEEAIVTRIRAAGFAVCARKRIQLTTAQASEFYKEHEGKPFYERLCRFMSSGPCEVLVLARADAVRAWRTLMGPTNTQRAREEAPDSMRALFGSDGTRNATHGSDSVASAQREIAFFFPETYAQVPAAEVSAFVQRRLQPVLSRALAELVKAKPANPLKWLGEYLVEHNPARPTVVQVTEVIISEPPSAQV